ncbi:putative protein YcjX [Sinobacterium norvegicum]|uniref:ATPase n=1 Tax=Sinobacterium norvegicum TaxID=1641715 RepID=A0ABM9AG17_9GAMM|nr:YcjX family protein [Sinobacterium norvegicum]CAH0991701.1 putative protein YcjX [Sinobacterium norvegicum]
MGRVKNAVSRGKKNIERGGRSAGKELLRVSDKLSDSHLCVGVTGLSRSGKTTFVTSLINQLLTSDHSSSALAGFGPALTNRIVGVKLHPAKGSLDSQFPYQQSYQSLCGQRPQWPSSTTDISGCVVELRLAKRGSISKRIGKPYRSLMIEILDYPGEWLLDLPLLDLSFEQWCRQSARQFQQGVRQSLLQQHVAALADIDALADYSPDAGDVVSGYKQLLLSLKQQHNLSFIQPGRFLMPGDAEAEMLQFFPLLNIDKLSGQDLKTASSDSFYKVFEQRYNDYIADLVKPFYRRFFSKIDRQLVLVDLISALQQGEEHINDLRQSLSAVLESFSYARQSWLRQLISPRIEKVSFVATKVDQVVSKDHDNVRQLLATLIQQSFRQVKNEGIEPYCEAAAAVRTSVETTHNGDAALIARQLSGERVGLVHPEIPARMPEGDEWRRFDDWPLKPFQPAPGVSFANGDPLPHIRVDSVINSLIGDKCS